MRSTLRKFTLELKSWGSDRDMLRYLNFRSVSACGGKFCRLTLLMESRAPDIILPLCIERVIYGKFLKICTLKVSALISPFIYSLLTVSTILLRLLGVRISCTDITVIRRISVMQAIMVANIFKNRFFLIITGSLPTVCFYLVIIVQDNTKIALIINLSYS